MKICHLTTVDLSVRFLLLNQLLFLKRRGMEVHAACADGEWVAEVEAEGVAMHRLPMVRSVAPLSDLYALVSLVRLFRRERFDLVHLHTPKASLLGALAARLAGVAHVVYTVHGFYFHDGMAGPRRRFYRFCEKVIASRVDAALSQNRADIDTALREAIYRNGGIEYLGNGIDVRRFDPASVPPEAGETIRRSLGISAEGRVVGIVARLVEEKGFLELFTAVKMLLAEFPGLRLLAVGPLDERKSDSLSRNTAHAFGIDDRVIFTGMRLDLPEIYSAMDVFVLPSHREGFPRVLMEASSMGLPVVASDIRGCREAVEDGRTGVLVPVRDAEALAEAIGRILRDTASAAAMGREGRRKALAEFDERRVFETVAQTYDRLAGNPR